MSSRESRRVQVSSDGVVLVEGREALEVVGESFYQETLWTLVGGPSGNRIRQDIQAILVAEDDNEFDANAISVWISGHKVGHLSREDAARLRPGLLTLQRECDRMIALIGTIAGGGAGHGRAGMLGVFLDYDPERFGLMATSTRFRPTASGSLRTGLSQAVDTDDADDSYDLGWLSALPGEPTKRVARLKELLSRETDLISRHYLFAELESTLYGMRDAWDDALVEYDGVCRSHDGEMVHIVSALLVKFGVVPLLDTYRQAAIRHQKAGDLAEALWWAERGIELYQDKPAKSEMLLDLHKRAGTCRTKIDRSARSRA